MDNQRALLLNWTYLHQEKSMDDLRQSLLLTMELEDTRLKAQQEINLRDEQITHLKDLLTSAIRDRDEAQEKCNQILMEKMFLQQQMLHQSKAPHSGVSSIEDNPKKGLPDSSDCDESIVSSPATPAAALEFPVAINRPLPEKGKLLQAVMKAGPLLQTLLLAGPLPRWRHPPPPLDSHQIPSPPVAIPPPPPPFYQEALQGNVNNCGRLNRKRRGGCEGSDSKNEFKYQRVVLQ